jgi:hypothetical protein
MTNKKMRDQAINVLLQHIAAPLVYLIEQQEAMEFIYVCDFQVKPEAVTNAEYEMAKILEKSVLLTDIHELSILERAEVIQQATLVRSADKGYQKLFEMESLREINSLMGKRKKMIEQKQLCGTFHLQ